MVGGGRSRAGAAGTAQGGLAGRAHQQHLHLHRHPAQHQGVYLPAGGDQDGGRRSAGDGERDEGAVSRHRGEIRDDGEQGGARHPPRHRSGMEQGTGGRGERHLRRAGVYRHGEADEQRIHRPRCGQAHFRKHGLTFLKERAAAV